MNLKDRLSLYSVLIFSVVIFMASAAIYISFYKWMQHNEIQVLESKTLLAAIYYLEADEESYSQRETTKDRLRRSISRKNIAVFDEESIQAKGEMESDGNITQALIESVRKHQKGSWTSDQYFYSGLFYKDNEGDFVVITRELKNDFNQQLYSLLKILIIVFVVGLILIYVLSQFLGRFAYQPLNRIIDQIKMRDNQNFNKPIESSDAYTEISDLVTTYNHFINRLDKTFQVQKNFIDYVSHELRTPITALLGTLEVTGKKERSPEEYRQVLQQLKQYVVDLDETLDKMMLLSGAKTNFEFSRLRMDEIIWEVVEQMILYHKAQIDVTIEVKKPELLQVQGNQQLLKLAFNNILENAVKYSNNQPVKIILKEVDDQLWIQVLDSGIGIPEEDLRSIKQNFFRGKNTGSYTGKGIGLSMANIIFMLHHIQLDVLSNQPKGTLIQLGFPNEYLSKF
ncbi:MAG TPA: HAMP domain-containing sensor histidine kinase [Flavobacterium sp.]|nr:HAMP domain-containing sensor histidine kinase [Flavobacterium sp.]